MMNLITISNEKGGEAKTTATINLGAALALIGESVLLIDADPQGNLTTFLGLAPAQGCTRCWQLTFPALPP